MHKRDGTSPQNPHVSLSGNVISVINIRKIISNKYPTYAPTQNITKCEADVIRAEFRRNYVDSAATALPWLNMVIPIPSLGKDRRV